MEIPRNRTLETNGRRHLPLPTGPYQNVGFRDIMIGFSRRTGFMVRLYYPAADQSRDIRSQSLYWSNWLPHENYRQGYISLTGVKWSLFQKAIRWLTGDDCFIPALPKAKPSPHKMIPIVFSHGDCSCRTTYSSLALEFASHGFIVAAVEHRDGTACCTFYAKETRMPLSSSTMNVNTPDGPLQYEEEEEEEGFDEIDDPNYVPPKALSNSAILPHIATEWIGHLPIKGGRYTLRNRQINRRVKECIRTLDLLEALEAGYDVQNLLDSLLDPSEFEGLIDISKAIIMGHSYGGATAIMTCSAELRFRLGICLDAWMYPIYKENFDLVTQPIFFINSEKFQTDENLRAIKRVLETNPYSCTDSANQSRPVANGNGKTKTDDDAPTTNTVEERSTLPDTSENKQVSKDCPTDGEHVDEPDSRSLQNRVATIKGTVHYNQTDIPFVMPWLIKAFYGGNSRRNPFTALDLTTTLAMEFISQQLKLDFLSSEKKVFLDKQRKKIKLGIKDKL